MLKKSRKKVGKPTGETTKSGRPVYIDDDTGERRSEFSRTIKLKNGKWINIPSIHNGHYYTEDELKEAVEDNRMIPTSEHDNFNEAIAATKKRSKELKQGGVLKAHQGTIVNGQIVYPTTSQAPADPEPIVPTKPRGRPDVPLPFEPRIPRSGPFEIPDFMQPDQVKQTQQVRPTARPAEPAVTEAVPFNPAPNEMGAIDLIKIPQDQQSMPTRTLQDFLNTQEQRMQQQGQQMQQALNDPNIPEQFKEGLQNRFDRFNFDMKQKQFLGDDREKQREFSEYQSLNQNEMGMRQGQEAIQNLFRDSNQQYDEEVAAIKEKYNTMGGNPAQNFIMRQRELMDAMGKRYRRNKEVEQGDNYRNLRSNLDQLQFEDAKRMFDDFSSNYKAVGKGQSVGKPMQFNEGGTVMDKQMEMNFGKTPISQLAEGGMKDDGGEKDPVSGNDVPSGSMAKEVRDDVPAMVSEGEFIFPADVTRFIGLNNLMEMRQDAKMGLKKMEMMGQLGDPEDAVLPDDIPFDAADIIIVDDEMEADEKEMEVDKKYAGGVFGYQSGTGDPRKPDLGGEPGSLTVIDPEMGGQKDNKYYNIQEEGMKQYARRYVIYRNDAGQTIKVLSTANGSPIDTVPAGYKMVIDANGLPATELPDSMKEEEKKPEVKQPTVQQRDDDDDRDPMDIVRQGRESAKITADRLGMDLDEYINLPIKTRFNLLSEELNVMRGGTLDIEKRDAILAGAEGDGIFGGSLIGGVFDMIGSVFDKDNDGSMWTSTDKDGNVRNIFGQIIQTGVDVSKMGILKDGRWTGAATTTKKSKDKGGSGNLNASLEDTSKSSKFSIDEKKQGFQARKHGSYKGVTKSDPYASKAAQFKRDEDDDFRPGQVFETKKQKQDKEDNIRDFGQTSNRGTQSGKSRAKAKALATSKNVSVDTARGLSGAGMEAADASRDKSSGPFNKGTLITKRSTKKKPTKGKTLVTKRS